MKTNLLNRRSFLGSSALVGAGLVAQSALGQSASGGSKKIKFGLIGCGGRGKGAVKNFMEACKLLGLEPELVATADAFSKPSLAAGPTWASSTRTKRSI